MVSITVTTKSAIANLFTFSQHQNTSVFSTRQPTFTSVSSNLNLSLPIVKFCSNINYLHPSKGHNFKPFSCNCLSTSTTATSNANYEFVDAASEVELRLPLRGLDIENCRDIFVDADGTSLLVRAKSSVGSTVTLIETNSLFGKIKASETIWFVMHSCYRFSLNIQDILYKLLMIFDGGFCQLLQANRFLDDDQLVINLKKQDQDLKWPDMMESWQSLTAGALQLLKGTSIYIVGDSTEINQKVARELAVGIGYTSLDTRELLETFAKQTLDSWVLAEGSDSIAEAESSILESLSSHVRAVVSTLGGKRGAARSRDKWRHLYAGFTVWLSQTEAVDETSAKAEARRNVEEGGLGYSNADVVVKLQGWDADHAKSVGQASLSALKQLILSDKQLPGKKSLYIRLGCRGDWPNIQPPGWDPSFEEGVTF